ncbi:DUF4150 domain-containing protein [Puniceibacterium sp. IMCC21224]|uniref:DUF4150 domain-containing protein n=1 Tax=Puniceibacterium sp. IMCC21224 TaxID=1618204 RepID=UPI00064DD970|nr:DUF4150 domain-containing protein [Puniceibacterium sp. IMCC21224]KMK69026.1 protein of unknown function (DUF4150) [Puniceibacterium sp. IMCC21224]
MPVTVTANSPETVIHASSLGTVKSQTDVCKTPTPGGPVPTPYPNIAMSANLMKGTSTVKCDGCPIAVKSSMLMPSTGDEAGSLLGVKSSMIKGQADPVSYSFDIKADGQNVVRRSDLFMHNKKNTI